MIPDRIGSYRVLRPLARGGMAEVYEVAHEASGEHLALKLLLQVGGALPRFNREYEAMIRLNHPNIVRVYHYGLHEGKPWLTMELVEGTQVQAYAKRLGKAGSPQRTEEVLRISHDLALALDHIHQRGLVHRDLKSANVLVLSDGRVKLLDFGTARVTGALEEITREGEFLGTFAYAAPEQILGRPVDSRADLYAFGVLLYRLATGRMPFESEDVQVLARMHIKQAPRRPSELANIDHGLEQVILSLLEKKPENRPQTGADVARALEGVAGHPLYLPGTLDVDSTSDVLVGREEQHAALRTFLDQAADPAEMRPGAVILVSGGAGAGRHRVMEAVERDAIGRKWRCLQWKVGTSEVDDLIALLLQLGKTFGNAASPAVRGAMLDLQAVSHAQVILAERLSTLRTAGATLLEARANADRAPVLVLVRDLELATPVGIEALVGLREAVEAAGAAALFAADCLDTADEPDTAIRKRLPHAERVVLPPLSHREVALLVGAMLHRRPPPASVARQIWRASGGMPSYIEEVVKGMVDDGILRVQGRDPNRIEWTARENRPIPVPAIARARIAEQLAQLPVDRRRVLEVLAVGGGEASADLLGEVLGCTPAELEPALAALEVRGWVFIDRTGPSPYLRWRQFLAEAVVLGGIHPARRGYLQRRLAALLSHEPAFVAQVKLLLEIGEVDVARARAMDWALHHLARDRPITALEVLDPIMPHVNAGGEFPDFERARLCLLHATALLLARPTDPGLARSLGMATRLVGTDATGLLEAEVQLLKARVHRVVGHFPNFRRHLTEAWYGVEHQGASDLAATIADLLGWSHRVAGLVDEAATWHGRARRIATQVGDPVARARADIGVGGWQYARGLLVEAERTAVAAIAVFDDAGDIRGLSNALPVWVESLRRQGRFSEALAILEQQLPAMRNAEVASFYVRLLLANAELEMDMCRLGRAQECVDELGATLRKGEHLDLRLEADLLWGRILCASGELTEARTRLGAVRDRARVAGLGLIAESASALLAEVLWEMGEERSALETFDLAIAQLVKTNDVPALGDACAARARALSGRQDPEPLFVPMLAYLESQPATILDLQRRLASLRWANVSGRDPSDSLRLASGLLDRVAVQLNDTDRAALRLHPWSRELRLTARDDPR
nr:protein kinase [Deltaproteobacteria bacterium]